MEQKPSIGRIVLIEEAGETRPAIVLKVHSETLLDLHVFGSSEHLRYDVAWGVPGEGAVEGGFWFWPPRVP